LVPQANIRFQQKPKQRITMSICLTIVRNTLWWVFVLFVLFALLLALGVQALRPSEYSVS
jgi:type IV secretory pathway component VirB8